MRAAVVCPGGLDQPGFVKASVEFDDHADLLVGESLGQDLQAVPRGHGE